MSRNGSGVYVLPTGQPVVTGTTISSTTFNTLTTDLANALTTSVASDGQTTMTANLPMGGNKITGLAAAANPGEAVRYEQITLPADLASNSDITKGSALVGYLSSFAGSTGTTVKAFLDRFTSLANGATAHSDGTNTLTGSPRWFIGNNAPSTDDSAMLVGRGLTGSYNTGAHAFRDESSVTYSGSGLIGYASFDSIATIAGTLHYNHSRSYQARLTYTGSGINDEIAGYHCQHNHTGTGVVTNLYGVKMSDTGGTGPINFQAALWCDPLTRGTSNYCIYSQSASVPSYHAGVWQTGSDIIGGGKGTFTSQILGKDLVATGAPTLYSGSGGATLYYNGSGAAVLRGYSDNTGAGTGFIQFQNGNVISAYVTQNALYPGNDNLFNLGAPSNRFQTVYAGTGAINTSDGRYKQDWTTDLAPELRAWSKVNFGKYKFRDSVAEKLDGARWHFGVIAQHVEEAFKSEGLNAFDYGVLCYDEWDAVEEIRNSADEITTLARAAGNRYGVRYDEAFALECALMRARLEAIESKVSA